MKVCFSNVNFSSRSGPNSFAHRLANCLSSRGVEIVNNSDKYDTCLVFIEPSHPIRKGARVVQRLDGIWFKPEEFRTHNVNIKAAYDVADHVIWQTEFDRSMITHHWGTREGSVILNGIRAHSAEPFAKVDPFDVPVFVSSANWHPQKRLVANLELFQHIRETVSGYEKSRMIVLGDTHGDYANLQRFFSKNRPGIQFVGDVDHETCLRVYASASWMIHLAWLDHCPNVVIESLSQGCPVICTSSGGTQEIVRDRGIVVRESSEYRYELTDYDSPPRLDFSNVVALPQLRGTLKTDDLDIELVTDKYMKVLFP